MHSLWTSLILLVITQLFTVTVFAQTFTFNQTATGPNTICQGSNITLQCVIVLKPGNAVQAAVWSRNGMPVVVTNSSGSFTLPNHRVVLNTTTEEFTDLVIANVTLEDDNTVYTCTATGASITSSVVLNVTGLPFPNNNLSEHAVCLSDFTVSWSPFHSDAACGPLSYAVTISPSDGVMIKVSDTSYNFTELMPATNYTVTVSGINMAGAGESTKAVVTTPHAVDAVPTTVRNLKSTSVSNDTIVVLWSIANSTYCGDVLYYMVTIRKNKTGSQIFSTITEDLCFTFVNLMDATTYIIMVTAVNRAGSGNAALLYVTTVSLGKKEETVQDTCICEKCNNHTGEREKSNDNFSNKIVLTISIAITFIITFFGTMIVSILITSSYYKYHYELKKKTKVNGDNTKEKDSRGGNITMNVNPCYGISTTISMQANPAYAAAK